MVLKPKVHKKCIKRKAVALQLKKSTYPKYLTMEAKKIVLGRLDRKTIWPPQWVMSHCFKSIDPNNVA